MVFCAVLLEEGVDLVCIGFLWSVVVFVEFIVSWEEVWVMEFDEVSYMDLLVSFQFKVFVEQVLCICPGSGLDDGFYFWFDDVRQDWYQRKSGFEVLVANGFQGLEADSGGRHIWFENFHDLVV